MRFLSSLYAFIKLFTINGFLVANVTGKCEAKKVKATI